MAQDGWSWRMAAAKLCAAAGRETSAYGKRGALARYFERVAELRGAGGAGAHYPGGYWRLE